MFTLVGTKRVECGRNTRIAYHVNEIKSEEVWKKKGKLHRDAGPALIYYRDDGTKYGAEWYVNGKRHRVAGPALTSYYGSGTKYDDGCGNWRTRSRHPGRSDHSFSILFTLLLNPFMFRWFLSIAHLNLSKETSNLSFKISGLSRIRFWVWRLCCGLSDLTRLYVTRENQERSLRKY